MNAHKIFNLVIAFVFVFSLFGMPAPVLATSQASVQSAPFTTCADVTEIPQAECEALIALYNSTNGAGWVNNTNWLTTNTPCSWYGVSCGGGYVASINLDANQLIGSIPTELDNLTLLSGLSLSQNQLSGSIPVELGNLVKLQNLSLWKNRLTGNIPSELGKLTQLEYLPLCDNQLTGNIPTELGDLTQLLDLCLSGNQLSGSIPTELGNLTQLHSLRLSNNQLSGSIPAELGNLTQLQQLHLSNNLLNNSIPVELGGLTQLSNLELEQNQLTGNIPMELGNLTQLTILSLDSNQLSGSIPAELGNLTNLTYLSLDSNQLTGNIPAELGALIQLTFLGLYQNQLSGSIPAELGNLTQLTKLWAQQNQLTGSIPSDLGNLIQLTDLRLWKNQLSGNIPAQFGNLTQLRKLHLHENQLTGGIPTEFGNLTQLTELRLYNNQLTGNIPTQLGNLTQLTRLRLGQNQLTGNIPTEFGNLTQLAELGLEFNQLTGNIPEELGNLAQLTWLNLAFNQLTGSIPAEIGNLTQLTELYLFYNQLSGEFPSSITNLVNLTALEYDCWLTSSDPAVSAFLNEKSAYQCAPNLQALPDEEHVSGENWTLGKTVTIEIDDPATQDVNPDHAGQAVVGIADWDPKKTRFDFNFNGEYNLKPGDFVTVSYGPIIKTHTVTSLAITNINPDTNMVSGITNTGGTVDIWICSEDSCVSRNEPVDQNGIWSVNFGEPGDDGGEEDTFDIQYYTWVDAAQYDQERDSTQVSGVPGSAISGTVYVTTGAPENAVSGVMVEACTTDLTLCRTTITDISGQYRLKNLPAGTYNLRAIPPGLNLPGRLGPVTIADNETLPGQDIILLEIPPSPPLNPIEPAHTGGGTIVVYWMNDLTFTAYGCVNGTASFEITVLDDDYTLTGSMTETPIGSGTYKAFIPPLYPHHGVAEVIYTINCPGGDIVEIPFFIYIDPSGVVKNTSGIPIQNATVTLFHADNPDGPFTEVPNDSTMMSPSNRDNPDTTNANGEFGWDVVAGFYKVRADKAGCFSPTDPAQTFVESAVLTIPPPVTDLELTLKCSSLPPSASAGGPYSINEGDTVTLDASASSDPEAGSLTYDWDLDNDGQYDDATGLTTTKTFSDNGNYIVGLKVTNQIGESGTNTAEVAVANISPIVVIREASANNLGILTGNGSFTDPGTDTWTATVNYGDGTITQGLALNLDKSFLLGHTYSANGDYTIETCVSDDDGGSGCDQVQVTIVSNQPPVADAGGPYFANEGVTINLSASKSTDPDNNIVRYEWDLDDDGQFDDATGKKPKFKAIDNGIFTVRVRVTDAGGLSSVDDATITVRNLPPVIKSMSVNSVSRVGTEVNTRAIFKDAGINDTFTAIWKWGDGTTSVGAVNGNTASGSHIYAKPGVYLVTITVKDKDGGAGQAYRLMIVLPKK